MSSVKRNLSVPRSTSACDLRVDEADRTLGDADVEVAGRKAVPQDPGGDCELEPDLRRVAEADLDTRAKDERQLVAVGPDEAHDARKTQGGERRQRESTGGTCAADRPSDLDHDVVRHPQARQPRAQWRAQLAQGTAARR